MPEYRTLTVAHSELLSPHMRRIVLEGEELADFPEGQESGYVKLLFPAAESIKPRLRSYTIRAFDLAQRRLTLDFVCHGDHGPASTWAGHAQIGDSIQVRGPGPTKLLDTSADWCLLVGDMSALPAISVNLERLPADARGYAVIQVMDPADQITMPTPAAVELHWVVNPHPETHSEWVAETVRGLPWLPGRVNAWVAGEFELMRGVRRYLRQERQLGKADLYASSYWKIGTTDEGNKLAKKQDPEAD